MQLLVSGKEAALLSGRGQGSSWARPCAVVTAGEQVYTRLLPDTRPQGWNHQRSPGEPRLGEEGQYPKTNWDPEGSLDPCVSHRPHLSEAGGLQDVPFLAKRSRCRAWTLRCTAELGWHRGDSGAVVPGPYADLQSTGCCCSRQPSHLHTSLLCPTRTQKDTGKRILGHTVPGYLGWHHAQSLDGAASFLKKEQPEGRWE